MATRDELLATLSERLDEALAADDLSALLGKKVLRQAEELVAQSDPLHDVEVAYTLGWLRWLPFEAQLTSFTEAELITVMSWFQTVYAADPDAVPAPLREVIEEDDPPQARADADRAERLIDEYEAHQDAGVLVRAIELLRAAIDATPETSFRYAPRLVNLSGLLGLLDEEMPEAGILAEAIDTARRAADAAADDDRIRWLAIGNLTRALWRDYQRTADPESLREAIELLQESLEQLSEGEATPTREFLAELTEEWDSHAEEFARAAEAAANFDVEDSISQLRAEFLTARPEDPDYGGRLANFANVLIQAYDYAGYPQLLDEAVRVAREGAALTPEDVWFFHIVHNTLAAIRLRRYRTYGDPGDLDHAVDALNRAIDSIDSAHAEYEHLTTNRALISSAQPEGTNDEGASTEAATLTDAGRTIAAPDFADDPERLCAVAGSLYIRADALHDMAAVSRAIGYTERALELLPAGDDRRGDAFDLLSLLHQLRYRRTDGENDPDAAVAAAEQAVRYATEPGGRRAGFLSNLASALLLRSAPGDAARRADYLAESVRLASASGDDRQAITVSLNEIGLLVEMGDYTAAANALTDSAGLFDATLAPLARRSPDHGRIRLGLAVHWSRIALATRLAGHFDQAIAATRRAVEVIVSEPNDNHAWLLQLAGLTRERATLFLDPADLDTAETALRHLIRSGPDPDELAESHWQLGAVLRLRHSLTRDPALLDEAVTLLRAAADGELDDLNRRKIVGPSLAAVLLARVASGRGTESDLDESVALLADSVADRFETGLDDTDLDARNLYNYAGALYQRYLARRDTTDLDAAIDSARQAADERDPGEPNRAPMLCNLAVYLHRRFADTGDGADWVRAADTWRQAWETPGAPLVPLLRIALGWGTATTQSGDPARGADILGRGVALLPALAWRGLAHADRRLLLQAEAGELTQNATAAAIAAGRFERAIELTEAGRGILWTQRREVRADIEGLRSAAPELADEFEVCAAALDGTGEPGEQETTRYERADSARRFERLLDRIRGLDATAGFPRPAEFLLPQPFSALRPQTPGEWIVLINCSELRCDAVAVSRDRVVAVPLPGLDADTAVRQAELHVNTVKRYAASRRTTTDTQVFDAGLARTAAWMWTAIAEPVLCALGFTDRPAAGAPPPRIWWCPTGVLTVMPLHAAGFHAEGAGRTVLDRTISSWATSLTHLAHARRTHTESEPATVDAHLDTSDGRRATTDAHPGTRRAEYPGAMLIFAVPETPGLDPIPAAAEEAEDLVKLLGAQPHTALIGAAATRAALLSGLADHTWLHVACHGTQDLFDPADAGLYPYDWQEAGVVGIDDLTGTSRGSGEFAFLSACETHVGDARNLDESITLAAALQSRGWRHVIGAMWAIGDVAAHRMSQCVYPALLGSGRPSADAAATALHGAAMELRDAEPHAMRHWAAFLHIGP
ncbi:CHAT domain-containing protein [Nocardia sp. bgisy134]|uniref:CHAT domain-containing protein n=1 Tax=Nocardia sp. bgisy134 TaxID=3413789 RepID=UPI003D730A7E